MRTGSNTNFVLRSIRRPSARHLMAEFSLLSPARSCHPPPFPRLLMKLPIARLGHANLHVYFLLVARPKEGSAFAPNEWKDNGGPSRSRKEDHEKSCTGSLSASSCSSCSHVGTRYRSRKNFGVGFLPSRNQPDHVCRRRRCHPSSIGGQSCRGP